MSGYIGQDVPRVEGPAKVTGSARYSGEITLPDLAYAEIVGATVASGQVTSIDTTAAERADGVIAVLTLRDMPKINHVPLVPSLLGGPAPGETFFPLQDDAIHYAGQPVAIVVADTLEQAQHAATLVEVKYAETPSITTIAQGRKHAYQPERIFGGLMPAQTARGDADAGLAAADVLLDAEFRFAANHHNALEPLTTTAAWEGDELTLYDSCQGIKAVQLTVAALLGMSPSKVRVLTSFVGGAFGSKAMVWPHVTLTAIAARHVGRPVRFTAPRGQMFTSCGHREEQELSIELGAKRDGRLTAIRHRKISVTSPFDDWAEPAFGVASQLYASPAYEGILHLVRGNTMTPTFTRGPGEAVGVFTLECAMDELASELGIDPITLRLLNLAETQPGTGNPWSSYGLRECLQRGAELVGWERRDPRPRSERDGNWLIGTGMARRRLSSGVLHADPARPGPPVRRRQRDRADRPLSEFGTGMLRRLAGLAPAPRRRPGSHSRPHGRGRARALPRPGRLRRRGALDQGGPRGLDYQRVAQLRRSRDHPARRHRAPLALRRATARRRGAAPAGRSPPGPSRRAW